MSDLLSETRISMSALARREGVHVSTAWRWLTRGVRGAKLPSYARAGRRYTTEEAFVRWVLQSNAAATSGVPVTPIARNEAIRDEQFLISEGA